MTKPASPLNKAADGIIKVNASQSLFHSNENIKLQRSLILKSFKHIFKDDESKRYI